MIASLLSILVAQDRFVHPPSMPRRPIAKWDAPYPGTITSIAIKSLEWTLFVPNAWKGDRTITVHFHGAVWHAIQEHLDRGIANPLLVLYPGEGSAVYQKAVADPGVFDQVLTEIQSRLKMPSVEAIDVTSFSAGYGAVREWVKQPRAFALLRRVILADSIYGSLASTETRKPAAEHIDVWLPLANAAAEGKKEFVITVSEVKTPTYASSLECAQAIVERVGGAFQPITPGTLAATLDREFPVKSRFDKGKLHIWHYGGEDSQAHMTHARHIAAIWKALDVVAR